MTSEYVTSDCNGPLYVPVWLGHGAVIWLNACLDVAVKAFLKCD